MSARFASSGNLQNGFTTCDRAFATGSYATGLGYQFLTGVIAPVTMTATYLAFYINTGATASNCFLGIYRLDTTNNATLLGTTADISSMVNTTGYVQATLVAPVEIVATQPYAVALVFGSANAIYVAATPATVACTGPEVPLFSTYYPSGGGLTSLPTFVPMSLQHTLQNALFFEILS